MISLRCSRRRRPRVAPRAIAAIACTLVGLGLGGCGGGSGPGGGDPSVLRLLYWQAPTILNPHLATGFKDFEGARITYEPLATYDRDGNLIPILAAEIPSNENGGIAPDGTAVTWKLRDGLKWSDGQPFTAEDVVFTFEYLSNPEVAATTTADYAEVDRVEALDPTTVKITFKQPTPAWSQPFVGLGGAILPRHVFESYSGANAKQAPANTQPVGTGPYRVVEFRAGDIIVYEPNPHFREAVPFRRIELKGGGDATSAARAVLQTGDADYAYNPQVEAPILKQLEAAGKGRLDVAFGSDIERLYFNFTDPRRETADGERSTRQFPHPFLSDRGVREAFSLAIDRQAIAQQLYGPTGKVAVNMLVSPQQFDSPNTAYRHDPAAAIALLEQAGWRDRNSDGTRDKNGVEMAVTFVTSVNPLRQKAQEIIKQNLSAIGVGVELKTIDASVYFSGDPSSPDTVNRFEADLQMFTTGNSSPDPGAYMKWWTCDEIVTKANEWSLNNYARYCNPEYDRLWTAAAAELDADKRRELLIQMNDLLINDVALVPLVVRASVGAVSNRLEGVRLTPWDADTWNIKDWKRPTP
ncbi:MAG: peptide ABC transporter substrate-binding protein [Cyanophyceae cyanobacterium]